MLTFFDSLFIIILGFLLLGYLMRLFFPVIMRWWTNRLFNRMDMKEKTPSKKKKGKVEITSPPPKNSKKSLIDEIGEYTDYEDID